MMASFGATCILLAIVTGSTVSTSVEDNMLNSNPSGAAIRMPHLPHKEYRIDNNKLATIWLPSPQYPSGGHVFRCTGTIISRQHVLTAATCASAGKRNKDLVISGPDDHLQEQRSFTPVHNISISKEFDLAVLRVKDSYFSSSSVAKLLDRETHIVSHDKCKVSGWFPSSDMWAFDDVEFLSNEECSFAYQGFSTPFNKNNVCSAEGKGDATCSIGLGWSLVCNDQLTGVYSWTHHDCKRPNVYASVESALPWLESVKGSGSVHISSTVLTIVAALAWTTL